VDLRDLEQAARAQGWKVDRTAKGHPRFTPPDPTMEIVIGSGTPSDVRSLRNLLARLRRAGLVWPPPK
jgi:hypothetical protein